MTQWSCKVKKEESDKLKVGAGPQKMLVQELAGNINLIIHMHVHLTSTSGFEAEP